MKPKKKARRTPSKRRLDKLLGHMENNDKSRFRSYVKKHDFDVHSLKLGGDQNLLHLAAKQGNGEFVRYFLKKRIDPNHLDANGNLPLHIAIEYASQDHKSAYTGVVLPLIKANPESLDVLDGNGRSPRTLLEDFKSTIMKDIEEDLSSSGSADDNDDQESVRWQERLEDELSHEYYQQSGASGLYVTDDSNGLPETWDEWADRIYIEHKKTKFPPLSRKTRYPADSSSQYPDTSPQPAGRQQAKVSESKREALRKHLAHLERERQQTIKLERFNQRIADYEHSCQHLFGDSDMPEFLSQYSKEAKCQLDSSLKNGSQNETTSNSKLVYCDIPWPTDIRSEPSNLSADNVVEFLFDGLMKGSKPHEKYLKLQQRRWHPDRFLQKCGSRLSDKDRTLILDQVTKISQILNNLSDSLK